MKKIIPVIFFIILIASCGEDKEAIQETKRLDSLEQIRQDSIRVADSLAKYEVYPKIKYNQVKIKDYKHLKDILAEYKSKPKKKILMTLNRQETRFLKIGETIVLPDTIIEDVLAYSVFPQWYEEAKDIPKIIVVSNKYQCYGAYENGKLVHFAAVNSGKERTPTFPGRYALVWKQRVRRSSLDSTWVMPFTFNFHSIAGSAFHQFTMPGRPVSHSCVRQFMDDAEWLFNWGEQAQKDSSGHFIPFSGTPVLIIDIFDFSRKTGGPWLDLKSNKDSILQLPDNPLEYEEALIPYCQIPLGSRSIAITEKFKYAEDTLRARGIIKPHVRLIHTRNFNVERRKKREAEAKAKADSLKKAKADSTSKKAKPADSETDTKPKTEESQQQKPKPEKPDSSRTN